MVISGNAAAARGLKRDAGDGGRRFVASEPVRIEMARTASGVRIVVVLPESW